MQGYESTVFAYGQTGTGALVHLRIMIHFLRLKAASESSQSCRYKIKFTQAKLTLWRGICHRQNSMVSYRELHKQYLNPLKNQTLLRIQYHVRI